MARKRKSIDAQLCAVCKTLHAQEVDILKCEVTGEKLCSTQLWPGKLFSRPGLEVHVVQEGPAVRFCCEPVPEVP